MIQNCFKIKDIFFIFKDRLLAKQGDIRKFDFSTQRYTIQSIRIL